MIWQKSLLRDADAPVKDIKWMCHCVNLTSSLFVSNPAPELISDNNSEVCFFFFRCSLQLWKGISAVSSKLSLYVWACATKRVVGRARSLARIVLHTFGVRNFWNSLLVSTNPNVPNLENEKPHSYDVTLRIISVLN